MSDSGEIVQRAKRKHGVAAAALAGGMVALRDIFERPRDEIAVVQETGQDVPPDIDEHGITVELSEHLVVAPPLVPLPSASRPRRGQPVV